MLVPSVQASDLPTHVTSMYSSSRPIYRPSHLTILHNSINHSVSLSQTPYEPPSAHFSPFIWVFSPFHLTIDFELTDSIVSTNEVSYVTAKCLNGYLRILF